MYIYICIYCRVLGGGDCFVVVGMGAWSVSIEGHCPTIVHRQM